MKTINVIFLLCCMLAFSSGIQSQNVAGIDSTGLPGDNFSLQGALEMFKKAASPEAFEKLINSEDNSVNNLDLNEDGEIDYIRVIDKSDNGAHAFILQVAVSATENQDIAVIELEKTGDASAVLQIVGDEDLYGEQVIMEPGASKEDNSFIDQFSPQVAGGPYVDELANGSQKLVVNIWFWPSVQFIYAPAYRPWASPWRWHNYPGWWRPWRPHPWRVYYPRAYRYHRPFVVVHTHRAVRAHSLYRPQRVSSVSVRTRHTVAVNNYRISRKKTTVTSPRGNTVTRATTTTHGRKAKVKSKAKRFKVKRSR